MAGDHKALRLAIDVPPAIAQNQSGAMPAPSASPANPPSQRQLDLAAARAGRKAIFGQNMNLTSEEAKTFWPLFDAYEATGS